PSRSRGWISLSLRKIAEWRGRLTKGFGLRQKGRYKPCYASRRPTVVVAGRAGSVLRLPEARLVVLPRQERLCRGRRVHQGVVLAPDRSSTSDSGSHFRPHPGTPA